MASPLDIVRQILQSGKLGQQIVSPLSGQVQSTPLIQRTVKPAVEFAAKQIKQNYQDSVAATRISQKAAKVGWKNLPKEERRFAIENTGGAVMGIIDAPVAKALPKVDLAQTIKSATPILDDIGKGFDKARKIASSTQKNTQGTVGQQVRSQLLDRLTPVYDLVKTSGKKLAAEENPYKKLRLLAGISGKTESIINQGLKPVLQRNADKLDDLSKLLVLEREGELTARGFKRARNLEQINEGLGELEKKYGPAVFTQLRESANEVRQFGNKLLDDLFDAGIIDDKSFKTIRQNNQFYVPFEIVEHVADKLEKGDFARASFNVASQDVIKAIGSTTQDVADPLEALLRKTAKVTALAEKNRALKSLVNLRNIDPMFNDLIKPVVKGQKIKGAGTINLFENGKNVSYAVPELVERAIKNMDAQSSNILTKILSPFAKTLRAGATGLNIGFIPANVVRDVADAVLTEASETGVKGVSSLLASYPRAIFSAAKKGELYDQWLAAGGAQSTLTEQVFSKGQKTVKELAGKTNIFKKVLSSPKDLIEFANRVGEQSTRLARFQSGLKRGEGVAEAAFKSRDITLDFAKSGNVIKVVNQVIPFLNAGVQGSEKLLRLYKTNPKAAALYSATLYGVPSVLLYQHNSQFQDFNDIPTSERNEYWIVMARDRTPEEKANGDKIVGVKIPKGFMGKAIANFTDSSLDFLKQRDPQAFTTFLAETAEGISPIGLPYNKDALGRTLSRLLPTPAQFGVEYATNQDLYYGQPIVPRSMEGVAPEEQYKTSTSQLARAVGKATGTSPLMLENAASTFFGGVGRQILQAGSGDIQEATTGQIARRFSGIRSGRETDSEFDEVAKFAEKSKTESLKRKRDAEQLLDEIKQMPKTEMKVTLARLKKSDQLLYDKVIQTAEERKLGLTSLERYINSLGVSDGSRAAYIASKLSQITDKQEKAILLKNLRSKKILSDNVVKQLAELKKKGEF